MTEDILLKADKVTLAIEALKDGKLGCARRSWEDARIVLPGQELVLRNVDGQVHVVKLLVSEMQSGPIKSKGRLTAREPSSPNQRQ